MKVVLRYAQVVSVNTDKILPLLKTEEEVVEAPDYVKIGWYRVFGDRWIPPESQRYERKLMMQ